MFRAGDRVRIAALVKTYEYVRDVANRRRPAVGDIATVIEVYSAPVAGYRLECTSRGTLQWSLAFRADEIELESTR